MKKTIITLGTLAAVAAAAFGGVTVANATTTDAPSAPVASDVDPALQAWYDSDGQGPRPDGVKAVGSPAELAALRTSARAEGQCYIDAGYDVPIADVDAGEGIQVPEHITKSDQDRCMTLGQTIYDDEYERLSK